MSSVRELRFDWDPPQDGREVEKMRKQCDFSKAKKNPHARRLKKQITLRIDEPTIEYFRSLSDATGIRYQTLINLYLRDCATQRRTLAMTWPASA
jgi:uncharacterized protein (DUF4415 family)